MFHGTSTQKQEKVNDPPVYVDLTGKTTESDMEKLYTPVSVSFDSLSEEDLKAIMFFRSSMQRLIAKKEKRDDQKRKNPKVSKGQRAVVESLKEAKQLGNAVEKEEDEDTTYVTSISWDGDLAEGYIGVPIGFYIKDDSTLT